MTTATRATIQALPRVIAVLGRADEGDGARCPHCDAKGRYVYRLLTDDGIRGAMAGCRKLYPESPLAKQSAALLARIEDRAKKGWTVASWDQAMSAALYDAEHGAISIADLAAIFAEQLRRRESYLLRNGYRR